MSLKFWKDGIYGLMVGDALGVPVEFMKREELNMNPVTGVREYGTHDQPAGTWSDDSSMVLATMDSLQRKKEIDYSDIMDRFTAWLFEADYTPFQEVFDCGITTEQAIRRFRSGTDPICSGGCSEYDNGNGSLMRILPVCLYLIQNAEKYNSTEDCIAVIHNTSALTHGHLRSKIACGLYYFMIQNLLERQNSEKQNSVLPCLQRAVDRAFRYYEVDPECQEELLHYKRLQDLSAFMETPEEEIRSGGYVVDTLEAAVWCIITTDSYETALLKAVNLGHDTDTVGAVAGGLAGLIYGYDSIPKAWIQVLQRKDMIESLLEGMAEKQGL
ncbi:MAG: ADP-ribosylglycohydrolase family protein [Lachnospiraceae bacterium]|nr:ADP-ribosylglycohydrolase family protein [Lachnospiraceae bacterium]